MDESQREWPPSALAASRACFERSPLAQVQKTISLPYGWSDGSPFRGGEAGTPPSLTSSLIIRDWMGTSLGPMEKQKTKQKKP